MSGSQIEVNVFSVPIESADQSEPHPTEQWIHLLPLGEIQTRDTRNFVLDNPEAVIAETEKLKTDLPVDYEHQSERSKENGKPAPAAGWITKLDARSDGIWGYVTWTKRARDMLTNKEYRFLSPVLQFNPDTKQVRRIYSVALTNNPALYLKALCSANAPHGSDQQEQICKALDLPADADTSAVVEAISALKAAASKSPDPRTHVPMDQVAQLVKSINQEKAEISERSVQSRVDAVLKSGKLPPVLRNWATELCRSDPVSFDTLTESLSPMDICLKFEWPDPDELNTPVGGSDTASRVAKELGIDASRLHRRE